MTRLAKRITVIGLAAVLVLAALAAPAYAYFTDMLKVSGQQSVVLGYDSKVHEELENGNKTITIENTGETDIMVRVWIFGAVDHDGATVSVAGEGWKCEQSGEQQLWTYQGVLTPNKDDGSTGHLTSELKVTVNAKASENKSPSNFEITVVGQTSPAAYDDASKSYYGYNWK